jgi:hypothetical protein
LTNPPISPNDENEVTPHNSGSATDPVVHNLQTTIARLEIMLRVTRRLYADLVAAARAALAAHADGEPDPWSYLRDELPPPPPGHPLARDTRERR